MQCGLIKGRFPFLHFVLQKKCLYGMYLNSGERTALGCFQRPKVGVDKSQQGFLLEANPIDSI